LAAAALLLGHAPESVLNETTAERDLREAQSQGRLWVALAGDAPVGFAHVEVFSTRAAHLEEIDVHPAHGRRGLGTRLVAAVCEWAARSGYRELTLTTFRDVPWNMPFYARLGFQEVPTEELSSELMAVVRDETRRGLDPARRVVMRRQTVS
jgi:GNAT superfamily N-acetyltransferase